MLANARLRGNFRSSQGRMRAPAHITIGQLQVRFPTCLRRCPSLQPRQCEPESLMQYLTAGTSRVCLPGDRHSFSLQALRAVDPVCSPTPGLPLLFHWHYAHLCTWCEWPAAHLRCELYGLPKELFVHVRLVREVCQGAGHEFVCHAQRNRASRAINPGVWMEQSDAAGCQIMLSRTRLGCDTSLNLREDMADVSREIQNPVHIIGLS